MDTHLDTPLSRPLFSLALLDLLDIRGVGILSSFQLYTTQPQKFWDLTFANNAVTSRWVNLVTWVLPPRVPISPQAHELLHVVRATRSDADN